MSETKQIGPGGEVPQPGSIEFGEVGVKLTTAEDAWRFAKRAFESGLLPEQIQNANQAFVILCKGAELGLPPFASWTYVYLTKARRLALMTKGALAVVQSKPTFEMYDERIENEEQSPEKWVAYATAKRKGKPAVIKTFSFQDAHAAGLLKERRTRSGEAYDGPWQAFLKDMLLSRARGRVLDIAFAAELGGIAIEGVAEDADMMEARKQEAPRGKRSELDQWKEAERPALAAPRRDPLLDELKGPPKQEPLQVLANNAANEVILDASAVTIVEEPEVVVTKTVKGKTMPASAAVCERCKAKLNELGGCDVCGWPGEDIR